MSFLYPFFLLALSAVIIPIIIHLFHFRRFKKVYFSNINFLEKLNDDSQRQARLKHLLVLLSRIMAIIFLVLAFARPFIPVKDSTLQAQGNKISIHIDNSLSMEAGSSTGNLLDQAKQEAKEIAALFEPTDEYQLLTNDFEAKHQRFVGREEFMAMLSETDFSPSVRRFSEVMARQNELLNEENGNHQKLAFSISDFQANITDLQQADPDSLIDYFLIPVPSAQPSNLFIDSVWIDNPVKMSGQVITVQARIYNDSDQQLENQPVRLYINDNQRAVATYDIAPKSNTTVSLTYSINTDKIQQGYIEITDNPVTFDDRFYISFTLSEDIPVMIINQDDNNRFINALLDSDTTFIVNNVQVGSIDFSMFGSQNLIVLNDLDAPGSGLIMELTRYVEQGGNLMIFPSENINFSSYNELFLSLGVAGFESKSEQATRVSAINELHHIYSGVFDRIPENMDLPAVEQHYVFQRTTRNRGQFLLQLQNGNYFLSSTPSGEGTVYVSAVPANDTFSNFPRHAIFVPTLYNIALFSSSFYPLAYTIGNDEMVTIRNYRPAAGNLFRIMASNLDIIPETRNNNNNIDLILHGQIPTHGIYNLMTDDEIIRKLAFNYDRRESLLEVLDGSELEEMASGLDSEKITVFDTEKITIEKQMDLFRGGRQLWKIFLLIGLLFLLAEVILLRIWK
jgi:hypothetical protein